MKCGCRMNIVVHDWWCMLTAEAGGFLVKQKAKASGGGWRSRKAAADAPAQENAEDLGAEGGEGGDATAASSPGAPTGSGSKLPQGDTQASGGRKACSCLASDA